MRVPEQSRPAVRITAPVTRVTGLGDAIKNVTAKLGIPTCGGCQKRAEALNRWVSLEPRPER